MKCNLWTLTLLGAGVISLPSVAKAEEKPSPVLTALSATTISGYVVFEAGNNPNFTRSYGYTMEPTTHTGVLTTYQLFESFSFNFGIANTFGPTINGRGPSESYKTYMGSFTYTAPTNCGFLA